MRRFIDPATCINPTVLSFFVLIVATAVFIYVMTRLIVLAGQSGMFRQHREEAVAQPETPRSPYEAVVAQFGPDAFILISDAFYNEVQGDAYLAPVFERLDMRRQRQHFAVALAQILGGPTEFNLDALYRVHKRYLLSTAAYWRTTAHLMTVLTRLEVHPAIIMFAFQKLVEMRPFIVVDDLLEAPRPY